jgi:hypothetical protein
VRLRPLRVMCFFNTVDLVDPSPPPFLNRRSRFRASRSSSSSSDGGGGGDVAALLHGGGGGSGGGGSGGRRLQQRGKVAPHALRHSLGVAVQVAAFASEGVKPPYITYCRRKG